MGLGYNPQYDSLDDLQREVAPIVGKTVAEVTHYLGQPCIVFEDGMRLIFEYNEGYYYSEYTQESPSFNVYILEA